MNDIQMEQIKDQLPEMAQILHMYKAFEGDLRVIVKLPGNEFETRYSIKYEDNYPRVVFMS